MRQTGGQQAYPGAAVPQPSVMMPGPSVSTMPPAPQPRGFVPVSTPSEQAPATQQPSSPQVVSTNTFAAPPAPAATVQTADTSNVAGDNNRDCFQHPFWVVGLVAFRV